MANLTLFTKHVRPSGNWFAPCFGPFSAGAALIANSVRMIKFTVPREITIDGLATYITTLSASGNIQLALYIADATTGDPIGNPVASTGNLSTGSATAVSEALGSDVTLGPSDYWMAVNSDNSVAVCKTLNAGVAQTSFLQGSSTLANAIGNAGNSSLLKTYAHTFGTWPDMTGKTFVESTGANSAAIWLREA